MTGRTKPLIAAHFHDPIWV